MTLEALAEKTWKTQRMLLMPILFLGAVPLLIGLVVGIPLVSGLGIALLIGGGVGVLRLRAKASEFNALLADPQRVTSVIPIVQVVSGGIVTHYPVVVVADDGKAYRIGTWAKSVEVAVAPFLERFPHARGLEGDRLSAPDDSFVDRLKMIGLMLGSMIIGLFFAVLLTLPHVLSNKRASDAAYDKQKARNAVEAAALKDVATAQFETRWAACTVDSLDPPLSVFIDGAKVKTWDTRRDGHFSNTFRLSLSTASDRRVYRSSVGGEIIDALGGSKDTIQPLDRGLGIVGVRRDDALSLRLLDLDSGKVLCEGVASVAKTRADSQYEEDAALSNAVMRPFCKQMPEGSCTPEEVEAVAPAPTAVAPKQVKTTTPGNTQPAALNAVAPDRAGIQAAMRAITPNTRACYERALAKKPSLQGTLTMAFVIGSNGQVSSVSGSGFPDAAVTQCVTKAFQALRFTPSGASTPVRYPIVFKPSK